VGHATRRRLAPVVFAGALAFVLPHPLPAQQVDAADTAAVEMLLQLRIDGGPAEVVSARGRDTLTLVPVRRFLELAEVRAGSIVAGHRLAGVLQPGRIPFAFDTDSSTIARGDSVWHVAPASLAWSDGELYATTDALGAALDIAFQTDFGELILVASHTADLPVVRRLAREQRRRTLLGLPAASPWETSLPRSRRVADGAVTAVFIVTPNTIHPEQIIAALRAGKHVFCEKPLALDLADCLRVQEEAARHRELVVMIGEEDALTGGQVGADVARAPRPLPSRGTWRARGASEGYDG